MLLWINFQGGFPSQFRRRSRSRLDSFSPRLFPVAEETSCRRADGEEEYALLCETLPPSFQPQSSSLQDRDLDRIVRAGEEVKTVRETEEDVRTTVVSLQLDGVGWLLREERHDALGDRDGLDDRRLFPTNVPPSFLSLHLSLSSRAWSTLSELDTPLSSLIESALSSGADVVMTCTNPVCLGEHGCVGGDREWEGCCDSFLLCSKPVRTRSGVERDPFHLLTSSFLPSSSTLATTLGPNGSFSRRRERIGDRVYSLITREEGDTAEGRTTVAFCLTTDPEETEDVSSSLCLKGRFPPLHDGKVLRRRSSFARVQPFRLFSDSSSSSRKEKREGKGAKREEEELVGGGRKDVATASMGCQTQDRKRRDASTQTTPPKEGPNPKTIPVRSTPPQQSLPPPPPPPSHPPQSSHHQSPHPPQPTQSLHAPQPTKTSSATLPSKPRRGETRGASERQTITLLEARR